MSQICLLCDAFPDPTMRAMQSRWNQMQRWFKLLPLCHYIVFLYNALHWTTLQFVAFGCLAMKYWWSSQCNGGSGPLWASPVVCQRRLYTDLHWNFELTPARPPKTAIYRTIPKILNSNLFNHSARILLRKVASIVSLNQSINLAGDWMLFWFGCWLLLRNQGEG